MPFPHVVSRNLSARHIDSRYPGVYKSGRLSYQATILASSPSLYWRLGTNGLIDQSGNGRDGTNVGSVSVGGATGLVRGTDAATDFSGTGQYITATYAPFVAGASMSVELWADSDTNAATPSLWGSSGAGSRLYVDNDDTTMRFTPNDSTLATWALAWPGNDQTVHVVLTFNDTADSAELFINGISKGVQANAAAWNGGNFNAATSAPGFNLFNGVLDEVAVYERILTAPEILAHYNAGI